MSDYHNGLVSIIVASYNYEQFLRQRINSLLQQSHQNFEIIVIDDYSTDKSLEVLSEFVGDPRIRIIENKVNSGWVAVSNQGIAESRGEFLMFANCDDLADLNLISSLLQPLLDRKTIGLSFCRSSMIDESGIRIGSDFTFRNRKFRRLCHRNASIPKKLFGKLLIHSCIIPNLSGALMRRDVLEQVGIFSNSYQVCSDWDLFFRISKVADVSYISSELNSFRQHAGTIRVKSKSELMLIEICDLLAKQAAESDFFWFRISAYKRIGEIVLIRIMDPRKFSLTDARYFINYIRRLNLRIVLLLPIAFCSVILFFSKEVKRFVFGLLSTRT